MILHQYQFIFTSLILFVSVNVIACRHPEPVADESITDCWTGTQRLYVMGPRLYAKCRECHSLDGSASTGPTWKGLWERTASGETVFTDGTTLKDLIGEDQMFLSPEDYILQSMANPQQKIVMNYTGAMPTFQGMLSDLEVMALLDFMKNLDKFDANGELLP